MKKTALQICLVILMAIVSAQAQIKYRAHIPFDFTIGQKSYEAGDYLIGSINPYTANNIIAIQDAKARNSNFIMTTNGKDYSKVEMTKLIFNRYETQYFLAGISTPSFIVELSKSKAEKKLARNQKVQREIVALIKKN
jgi:hypothetical protein